MPGSVLACLMRSSLLLKFSVPPPKSGSLATGASPRLPVSLTWATPAPASFSPSAKAGWETAQECGMTVRQRSAGLALLLAGGVLAAALTTDRRLLGAPPVPVRTAQQAVPSSPEPPLADAPLAPVPAAPSPGPAPGTPNPV